MRKTNRKGFTLVELVIVIAVIAILAGVLIPTFGGIVDKANKSAALQEATSLYKEYVADFDYSTGIAPETTGYVEVSRNSVNYYVTFESGAAKKVYTAAEWNKVADTDKGSKITVVTTPS